MGKAIETIENQVKKIKAKKHVVGADAGKYGTKIVTIGKSGQLERGYLRSKVDKLLTTNMEVPTGKGHVVKFEDNTYVVGERASKTDYTTSKAKVFHKVAMFTQIMNMLPDEVTEIDLYAGCPLSVFVNSTARDTFRQFLLGNGSVELTIDGKARTLKLNKVEILPESLGYVYKDAEKNADRLVGVLDIGGLNVNGIVYDCLNPIIKTFFTTNDGSIALMRSVQQALNSGLSEEIDDYQIPHIIKNGCYTNNSVDDLGNTIIKNAFEAHFDKILTQCQIQHWSLSTMPIACIGGGSVLMEKNILGYKPNFEVSDSAIWDNAEAFYTVGDMISNG